MKKKMVAGNKRSGVSCSANPSFNTPRMHVASAPVALFFD